MCIDNFMCKCNTKEYFVKQHGPFIANTRTWVQTLVMLCFKVFSFLFKLML